MDLSNLKPAKGSIRNQKESGGDRNPVGEVHRRADIKVPSHVQGIPGRLVYEGGQMPLARRLPKYGFKNFSRVEYKGINLDVLQSIAEKQNLTVIDQEVLVKSGHVPKRGQDQDIWDVEN